MKIVFFGTPEFAVPILEGLLESSHNIVAVVTQPQKPRGRGMKVLPTPVALKAKEKGVEVSEFMDVNSNAALDYLRKLEADLFIVVAYGQILSDEFLAIPKLYSINVHASLLPKYRGAAPVQRAIIDGEKETGITIMRIEQKLDSGDIILQKVTDILPCEDALSLFNRLSLLGKDVLVESLDLVEKGDVKFIKQDASKATYVPKLKKEDGLIDWSQSAKTICNQVLGCKPWPSAYTNFEGKVLKIHKVKVIDNKSEMKPGAIIDTSNGEIQVSCGTGIISIQSLQLEGKKILSAVEFLRGKSLTEGTVLG
ncbi:MAG: methionyl-tRNA formyltransferase [Candidatus Omnitrophota bacterium]